MVIDHFNHTAAGFFVEENLSIDDQIIDYEGKKSSLRRYNPKKPLNWGLKVFVRSGRLGLIHRLEFHGERVEFEQNGQ